MIACKGYVSYHLCVCLWVWAVEPQLNPSPQNVWRCTWTARMLHLTSKRADLYGGTDTTAKSR